MKFLRQTLAVLLAVLMLAVPVTATESENWLIPKMREDPEFTDTAGTICQEAARICCEAGLMTGVDAKHFMPETGLTNAQIIVISARLHRLLKTGTVGEFDSYHCRGTSGGTRMTSTSVNRYRRWQTVKNMPGCVSLRQRIAIGRPSS